MVPLLECCKLFSLDNFLFPIGQLLPEWQSFSLHPQLQRALFGQKFMSPTPIQSQALPAALSGRDVIGVAETVRVFSPIPF